MEQQQQSHQTFPQDILDGIKQSILSNVPADDWQTEHRLQHNIFTDVEVQPLIAAVSNNFSDDSFHTNRSTLSLGELKLRFCKLFASVGVQENPKMLGGNRGNDAMMDVARGIQQKKVNLRSIPYGWNRDRRQWNTSYEALPRAMAFDIDRKDSFVRLWGPGTPCDRTLRSLWHSQAVCDRSESRVWQLSGCL